MAPHSLDTILRAPQWPQSLSDFVTWCLLWDPKQRPTSSQALNHEYFRDAHDPLIRPKSSSKLLGRKQSNLSTHELGPSDSTPSLSSKTSSWLRKSLIQREVSAPVVPQHVPTQVTVAARPPAPVQSMSESAATVQARSAKRATWANGLPSNAAPIPILPSIRPVSPLSSTVNAQPSVSTEKSKKIGRQLSVTSNGNHYADIHRQEAERALNGQTGLASPTSGHKESFFSHLRKRARRFSGRYQTPSSPSPEDIEANAGCAPWSGSNRQSMVVDNISAVTNPANGNDLADLDKALQNVRNSMEASHNNAGHGSSFLKRNKSVPRSHEYGQNAAPSTVTPSRPRKLANKANLHYDTPDEEEELLDEALANAHKASRTLDNHAQPGHYTPANAARAQMAYLTPASSAHQHGVAYPQAGYTSKPMDINKPRAPPKDYTSQWPTPPYEESEWAASASASIFAAQNAYR